MIAFHIDEHISSLRKLHQKYRDRPMSLADACIVRMAEIYERHVVLTLDSDFSVYRKHASSACAHPSGGGVDDRDRHYEGSATMCSAIGDNRCGSSSGRAAPPPAATTTLNPVCWD
jgi:hypothetical protein